MVTFALHGKHAQRFTAHLAGDDSEKAHLVIHEEANVLPVLKVTIGKQTHTLSAQHYTATLDHHDVGTGPFKLRTGTMTVAELRQAFATAPRLRKSGKQGSVVEIHLPL